MGENYLSRIALRMFARLRPANHLQDILAMNKAGDLRGAYATLKRRLKSQPAWAEWGAVYRYWAELEILVAQDPQKALQLLDEAERRGCSGTTEFYATKAKALYEMGECELGSELFEKAIAAAPEVEHMVSFGMALTRSEDERAPAIWEAILERYPENATAPIFLGLIAVGSGDENKARYMAKEAETKQLTSLDWYYFAWLYLELGDYQNAIRFYRQAAKDGLSDKAAVSASLAECYISLGNARAARRHAKRAMRRSPDTDYVKEVWAKYEDAFGKNRGVNRDRHL